MPTIIRWSYKYWELPMHCLFWLFYYFYPFMNHGGEADFRFEFWRASLLIALAWVNVYTIYGLLLPYKFYQSFGGVAVILVLVVAMAFVYCRSSIYIAGCECSVKSCFLSYTVHFTSLSVLFIGLFFAKSHWKNQKQIEKIYQEKLQAELQGLKAQVNPHFLFNTLNTLYSFSLTEPSKVPNAILQLADNLKYILYEGQKEYTTLEKEIAHIQNYVTLQLLRLEGKIKVVFLPEVQHLSQSIAPLLLISFVENAFKYTSLLGNEGHSITIKMWEEEGAKFHFYCANPFEPYPADADRNWLEGGIGLHNTERRLQLLYPEKYSLTLCKENNLFEVYLTISL
ncbi:MAG: hypothetical protein EAZ55_02585 [Cytophagales bacterium]|nr:MAG: hypothetical protein EAZ55_02585 [Cytophagales bacterium]